MRRLPLLAALPVALGVTPGAGAQTPVIARDPAARAVVYTFDDLPATRFTSLTDAQTITTRLLGHIRALDLPAIGFVNEGKLFTPPGEEDARTALIAARDYVRYMAEVFAFYEGLSRSVLEREPPQVLLLHANALNADWLDELATMIAARGYRAVTLDEALRDPAYALPDEYVGPRGPSWLERWARTRGIDPGTPPAVPEWVLHVGRQAGGPGATP